VSPTEEYAGRLKDRELRVAGYEKTHVRLGNLRLLLALMFAGMIWASFKRDMLSPWWLVVPVVAFIGIAIYHSRILRRQSFASRAVAFYRAGLVRLDDRWAGTGQTGDRFWDPHHVYAIDLDLFGRGSMFELLSTARTRIGEETLAGWLLAPGTVPEILQRHAAISELRSQLDLREDLAVLGEDASVGVHSDALLQWAEAPNRMKPVWLQWLAPVLAACAVAGAVAWFAWGQAVPLMLAIVVEAIIFYRLRSAMEEVLHDAEHAFHDLDLLSGVLARIEQQQFHTPCLQQLQLALSSHHVPGSRAITRLRTLVDMINSRHNVFVNTLDVPLLYSIQVALAAERWRRAHGGAVRAWLGAVGQIEALLSLAAYSYEHPADPFPEFAEGPACFEAEGLGHPLLPQAACIRNQVQICGGARVLLVSGSNMSGKSTLLRAVGLNVVLAMAGGPVRASTLRLTPLQIGGSIRVNDSLQEGSSRFYAEISRLRAILDLADGRPALLFLLDELLQGTNSKDRRIGAEGIVRALVDRGAIGLVSTHDLALTEIGGPLEGHLRNVHFQDEIENGRMKFDYTLHDGVVTKSNGLELMRSIGLQV
jgi:hypothetical protein